MILLRIEKTESLKNCSMCYLCNEKFNCNDRNYGKLKKLFSFYWKI